jgi:cell division inhibitor SulA
MPSSHRQKAAIAEPSASSSPSLPQLLQRPDVWQGARARHSQPDTSLTTGQAALDERLLGGGWPRSGLIELLMPKIGVGEFELLRPALQRLSQEPGLQLWVDPPLTPYPPALLQAGLRLEQLVIARPRTAAEWLWCCEQALRSGACSALLAWPGKHQLRYAELRKLQVAAADSRGVTMLLRVLGGPLREQRQGVPSMLRLGLEADPAGLAVTVLKQRGGAAGQQVILPIPERLQSETTLSARHHWRGFSRLAPLLPLRPQSGATVPSARRSLTSVWFQLPSDRPVQ